MAHDKTSPRMGEVPQSDSFHILSLSGGGFLGFFTALVLAELERRLGRPISRAFDLIAGTSIGGLLALALAWGVPADELVRHLKEKGTTIFSNRPKPKSPLAKRVDFFRYLASSKYRADVATPRARGIIEGLAEKAIEGKTQGIDSFVGHHAPSAVFYHGPNAMPQADNSPER